MVFSNLTFVCLFLPITLAIYFIVRPSARNLVLVVASVIFYVWGSRLAIVLVLASIAVNFALGRAISAAEESRRQRLIGWSVAGNLLVLIVFKYTDFIVENLNLLLSPWGVQLPVPHIPLPLGISFFTFHIISYLVDIYRRVAPAQQSPIAFALYIINFPQLIAGPIIRYRPISEQLTRRDVTFADFESGLLRFVAGLAKKLLIANPIGGVADYLFAIGPADLSVWAVWFAVVCYALQIYFDFSGYSDMAIGMARMFGFKFPENFNYPYAALSIQDFWRRWHITLSAWFRDYVYIPLGGSRGGPWRTVLNLWIVFLLCGAWHGASWNFLIWGLWHGLFLSIERIPSIAQLMQRTPAVFRNGYVLLIVLLGWVFFRSPTLEYAGDMLTRMFGLRPGPASHLALEGLINPSMGLLILAAAVFSYPLWPPIKQAAERFGRDGASRIVFNLFRAALVTVVTLLCVATMAVVETNPFIYFRF